MKAEIICIGDELLLGQIMETNSAWIAQQLSKVSVPVVQIATVADEEKAILEALESASNRAELVIITGGLGPTRDDVTKKTAAKYFNTTLIKNDKVLFHVKGIFSKLGYEMPAINRSQADVLACCTPLFNKVGTAPGMWIDEKEKVYIFLPGVPYEMKYLMEYEVLPRLQKLYIKDIYRHEYILTVGIGESVLAQKIEDVEEALPENISIAYLPKIGMVRLRLSGKGDKAAVLQRQLEEIKRRISEKLGAAIVAYDNVEFEEVLFHEMTKAGVSLATAESCTGGKIAANLTKYAGAGKVFLGSVVSYANEVKTKVLKVPEETLQNQGAVSEETVIAMVKEAKELFGSDYAVATSGIAGPTGGTQEKPVGTVWIAVKGKYKLRTKAFHFQNNRQINIARTTTQALLMLWDLFREEKIENPENNLLNS